MPARVKPVFRLTREYACAAASKFDAACSTERKAESAEAERGTDRAHCNYQARITVQVCVNRLKESRLILRPPRVSYNSSSSSTTIENARNCSGILN